MKITKSQLKQIIKEELEKVLNEKSLLNEYGKGDNAETWAALKDCTLKAADSPKRVPGAQDGHYDRDGKTLKKPQEGSQELLAIDCMHKKGYKLERPPGFKGALGVWVATLRAGLYDEPTAPAGDPEVHSMNPRRRSSRPWRPPES